MIVGLVRLLIYLWWCFHVDSWHVVSWLAYILDLESWSAFVWSPVLFLLYQHSFSVALVSFKHLFIDVRLFHCIIVEYILECLVWWHSVSYVGYYLTLGHTPILEFIRSFANFLITRSIFFYLYESSYWGIPPLALFYWRIPPSLSLSNVLQIFLTTQSISWYLRVIILEHTLFSTLLLGHMPSLGSSYPLLISWSFNPFADISLLLGHTSFFVEFIIPVTSLGFFWAFLVVDHIPYFLFLL